MKEILIRLEDELYEQCKNTKLTGENEGFNFHIIKSVANGTVLPKGHGDLIDKSKIYKAIPAEEDNCTGMGMTLEEMDAYNEGIDSMYLVVQGGKPIVEADKKYEAEVITRGNCMICGKELTEGLFICKECENKANIRETLSNPKYQKH